MNGYNNNPNSINLDNRIDSGNYETPDYSVSSDNSSDSNSMDLKSALNLPKQSNSTYCNSTYGKSPYVAQSSKPQMKRSHSVQNLAKMLAAVLIELYLFFKKR